MWWVIFVINTEAPEESKNKQHWLLFQQRTAFFELILIIFNIRSCEHILEFVLHDENGGNSCGESTHDVTMREFLDDF